MKMERFSKMQKAGKTGCRDLFAILQGETVEKNIYIPWKYEW